MMFNRKSNEPPPKGKRTLWLVAGCYLLYLVYQLLTDPNFKATAGFQKVAMVAGVILFIVFGVLFIVSAIKGAMQEYRQNTSPAEDDEYEQAELPKTEAENEENIKVNGPEE